MKPQTFSRTVLGLVPFLVAPAVVSCDCGDTVGKIAPQIYLDVCQKPQRKVNNVLIGGFEECAADFGTRDLSVKVTRNIKVTNPSIVALTLHNVEVIGDPSFKVELKPDQIPAGLSGDIVVSVRPKTESLLQSTLYIHSDANNTQQTPDSESLIEVPLTVEGVDNGIPDINVTPLACDFGRVGAGGVQLCPVKIENKGNRGLVLDSVDFIPPTDEQDAPLFSVPTGSLQVPYAFSGRPPGPDEELPPTVAPQQPVTLQVRFTPDVLGTYVGKFRILSNDPDEELIDVTLSGTAVTPPSCVARVKSVNGVDVGASIPEIEPLDDVVVTMDGSTPSSTAGSIASFEWQDPPGRPAGSGIRMDNPTGEDSGFTFDNNVGVDLAGDYHICGQVFDDLGTGSVNECCVTFSAIPQDHFLVQLTWDTADSGDMDLHVAKRGANGFCIQNTTAGSGVTGIVGEQECDFDDDNELDCNWITCKANRCVQNTCTRSFDGCTTSDDCPAERGPEWDGADGQTDGDPALDIDDIDGAGPENINIDVMPGGEYLVGVNAYSSSIECVGQVKIFIFGQLAGEFFRELNSPDWWEIALVKWPVDITVGVPCVEDLTDDDASDDCG